ncbi:MAG: fatty acyl-AMP ligase [Deltaproteobacteria bacterium]|jgi:acyl-CoA synthetase (AMP-forming)/AMP-acid ligase II|nr:fatty acyl-AMP ligase [Deltaproteobacteria bacterium]MBW2531401.1 fatty acyl-AMP ligase [Deltaproteobacteria bacterium]
MDYRTVVEALVEQARTPTGRDAFTVIDPDGRTSRLSADDLLTRSLAAAAALRKHGLHQGDRVMVCLPTSDALLVTVWGVLLAGGACVPLYPPMAARGIGHWKERVLAVARVVQPRGAVVDPRVRPHMAAVLEKHAEDRFTLTPDALEGSEQAEPAGVLEDDLAFVQFTSGTTRQPLGVAITHAALMANIRGLVAGLGLGPEDVSVSWLPPYHDMGLVGHVFTPLVCGAHQVLMAPTRFLVRPARWLQLIDELGGTQTTAPNTAYSICVRRIPPAARAQLDLSRVQSALCGAEPVLLDTHRRFCNAFAPSGFDPAAYRPVYGLAEATLAVCLGPEGGARFDWVSRRILSSFGVAEPMAEGQPDSLAFASVGRAIEGHEIAVVRPDGAQCGAREVGEIHFRGPSLMRGYFNDPMATRDVMRDGWLATGDLGYLAGGQLHVTGRSKELIIKAGRNYVPTDIEAACMQEPQLRPGRAVAFGLPCARTGTEDLVVVAEVAEAGLVGDRQLAQRVVGRVAEHTGVRPDRVELVGQGVLPKTSSGKLQRRQVRAALESGVGLDRPRSLIVETAVHRARSAVDLARCRLRRLLGWQS